MLPLLQARISLIFAILGEFVVSATPLAINFHSFKLKIDLSNGTTFRLNEQYRDDQLQRYAYYWLDDVNNLIIGWDNAPHHPHISTHPDHKHVTLQTNIHPSTETDLTAVLGVIHEELSTKEV